MPRKIKISEEKKEEIIKLLLIQKDQKLKLQEIADKTEVSLSTVKRIKRLQNVS